VPSTDHFRAFERRPTNLPALLTSEVLGWAIPAELIDLGLGGASVLVAQSLPLASTVRLSVETPQLWEPLVLPGRVAWTRPNSDGRLRLGLRFEVESANTLIVLAELIGPNSSI
jgi:hypothetical protein